MFCGLQRAYANESETAHFADNTERNVAHVVRKYINDSVQITVH